MYSAKIVLNDLETFNLPEDFCILDIETGGLSAAYSPVLLLGIAYIEDGRWVIESHLCQQREEEPLLIHQWSLAMRRFLLFFTYYGRRFDIPFLNARSKIHDLPIALANERHIDLYERGKLKDVEKTLGFHRTDQLGGKEWTHLFQRYEKEKCLAQRESLLQHNRDDLSGTIHLLLSRQDIIESLPWRFYEDLFLADVVASPGNIRLIAVDRDNRTLCRDLPLLSFGRYHFLDIKESFDTLEPNEKGSILLLDGRRPQYQNIYELDKRDELREFTSESKWTLC